MPIGPDNPFKGRQHPGDLIILCVRWYLQYTLSYQHVAELVAERGVEVDASGIWRWVQAYAPQLNKRCRPYLKAVNKTRLYAQWERTARPVRYTSRQPRRGGGCERI